MPVQPIPGAAAEPAPLRSPMGTAVALSNDWRVQTAEPVPYDPSGSAAGEETGQRFVRCDVTLINDTSRYANPSESINIGIGVQRVQTQPVVDIATTPHRSRPLVPCPLVAP
ncbi:hypothetical protein ACQPX6_19955 [Actinomycetospora sp. CA-101289]|uniref:hypothetical protein n=1 Tax=Actinomycetospora sp. CA-101289 TaxID=3239893 RepID=UPI003D965352